MRNAFHHAAVAHEGVGVVVDDIVSRTVELRRRFLGDSHPDRVSDTAQRTGGGFHACGVADFRVTRVLECSWRKFFSSDIGRS